MSPFGDVSKAIPHVILGEIVEGGTPGMEGNRGGPVTQSRNFYKNFSLPTTKTQINKNCCITFMEAKVLVCLNNVQKCQIYRGYIRLEGRGGCNTFLAQQQLVLEWLIVVLKMQFLSCE